VRLFDIEENDKVVSFANVVDRVEEKEISPDPGEPEPAAGEDAVAP
jgi:hypothetical protein